MPAPARRDVRKAWRRAHPRILLNGVHWGSVTGVMQATIATIGQLGWIPTAPDKWLDESRTQYADLNDAAPEAGPQIVLAVRRSAQRAVWRKAAEHHLGRGLEEGVPSMEAARAAKKWLNRRHQKAEAKALDAIICGGLWHGGRAGLQRICRCGKPETPYHRYWTCPKLDEIHDQGGRSIVSDTQWLEAEFHGPLGEYQCLWGRAILPASLCFPGQPVSKEQAEARYTHGFADAFAESKTVYTDGSGGPRHAPKEAPTAGSGLASIVWGHDHGRPVAKHVHFAHAAVPGGQTVPRGELWAACAAARVAPSMIGARIMADATYIVDTLKDPERLGKARAKANGDLWAEYLEGVKEAGADLNAVKVKAHMEPKELLNGKANLEHFMGNHVADAAAGAAAEMALEANAQATIVERWNQRAFLIARRLAAIEAWHWVNEPERNYDPPEPLEPWNPPDPFRLQERNSVTRLRRTAMCSGRKMARSYAAGATRKGPQERFLLD